jgi:hypothetical protein
MGSALERKDFTMQSRRAEEQESRRTEEQKNRRTEEQKNRRTEEHETIHVLLYFCTPTLPLFCTPTLPLFCTPTLLRVLCASVVNFPKFVVIKKNEGSLGQSIALANGVVRRSPNERTTLPKRHRAARCDCCRMFQIQRGASGSDRFSASRKRT